MTSASGSYSFCGAGQPFALNFTCTGPNCEYLNGFPGTNCTSDGTTLSCTNGVVCPTKSNHTASFALDQPLSAITQINEIFLSDACTEVQVSNNGTGSGVSVVSIPIANCTVAVSSSAASSSPTSAVSAALSSLSIASNTSQPVALSTAESSSQSTAPVLSPTRTKRPAPLPTSSGPAQAQTSNARAWRVPSLMITFSVIFVIFALFQTTLALETHPVDTLDARSVDLELAPKATFSNSTTGELLRRAEGSLGKQFTDLLAEYVAGKLTTPELADSVFAEIYNAICSHFVNLVLTTTIFTEAGQFMEYVSLFLDTIALPTGPAGWLIAFAVTVAANVLVSELFPQIDQMVAQACAQPKPCSEDFANDAMNCGICGNKCASGVCKNSACVSSTCTGETCATFTACGPGGTCVCASTAEGTGFCVDSSTPCSGLQTCAMSSDCPAGEICGVASCCQINVCVGATFCGGANSTSAAKFLFRKELDGPTVGYLY